MKVILLDNVKKLGSRFEVVSVRPGFAHNYLVPQKKAIIADDIALARIEEIKADRQGQIIQGRKDLSNELNKVTGGVTLKLLANEQGGLYQSVTEEQIADALYSTYQANIPADYVVFPESSIKSTGDHTVFITYDAELSKDVVVTVTALEEETSKKKKGSRKKSIKKESDEGLENSEISIERQTVESEQEVAKILDSAVQDLQEDDK